MPTISNGNSGNSAKNYESVHILLVEDNPGDILLAEIVLRQGRICNMLHVVRDGEEALDFLFRRGKYADAVRPHLILLDLNLPKKSGREVLAQIKEDSDLKKIPVCVLTGSKTEEDIVKSYGLPTNCYIVKPIDFGRLSDAIHSLENFWFEVVVIPNSSVLQKSSC